MTPFLIVKEAMTAPYLLQLCIWEAFLGISVSMVFTSCCLWFWWKAFPLVQTSRVVSPWELQTSCIQKCTMGESGLLPVGQVGPEGVLRNLPEMSRHVSGCDHQEEIISAPVKSNTLHCLSLIPLPYYMGSRGARDGHVGRSFGLLGNTRIKRWGWIWHWTED